MQGAFEALLSSKDLLREAETKEVEGEEDGESSALKSAFVTSAVA